MARDDQRQGDPDRSPPPALHGAGRTDVRAEREPVAAPLRRNRDFLILWSAEAVSELGTSMSLLAFPLVGYAITHSAALAGLATTAILVGLIATRLPVGALVDRWPRRRVLLVANAVAGVAYASIGLAAVAGGLTLAHLVVVGVLSGTCEAFVRPAASAAIRIVVPAAQLPVAYARLQARGHAAELIGPPLGGALFAVSPGLPFLVDAASYLIAAAWITRLGNPLPAPGASGHRVRHDVAEGLRFLWSQSGIRAMMLWGGILNFGTGVVLVVVTLRLVQAGVHPAAIGAVNTIGAVSALVGALVAPAVLRRARTGWLTVTTGLVLALVTVPIAFTTDVVAIGALLAAGSFLLPANNSGISAYIASRVPDHLQGRFNSAAGFVSEGFQPMAPVLAGGLLAGVGGAAATLTGMGLIALSLVPLLASREVRTLRRPDQWSEGAQGPTPVTRSTA